MVRFRFLLVSFLLVLTTFSFNLIGVHASSERVNLSGRWVVKFLDAGSGYVGCMQLVLHQDEQGNLTGTALIGTEVISSTNLRFPFNSPKWWEPFEKESESKIEDIDDISCEISEGELVLSIDSNPYELPTETKQVIGFYEEENSLRLWIGEFKLSGQVEEPYYIKGDMEGAVIVPKAQWRQRWEYEACLQEQQEDCMRSRCFEECSMDEGYCINCLRQCEGAAQEACLEKELEETTRRSITGEWTAYKSSLRKLSYEDDFSEYERGEYSILVEKDNFIRWHTVADSQTFHDFIVEVAARKVYGPDCAYGIIFRKEDNDNFYYFGISSNGEYILQKLINDTWETLIDWTESSYINQGVNWNHIKIIAAGPRISLYVNDVKLDSMNDYSLSKGSIAIAGWALSNQPNIEVHFDNLKIWSITD